MKQGSELVDRHTKMLDETVRRVVMAMPGQTIDIVGLRSELAKALLDGSTTLFHLFKVGRNFASRPAEAVPTRNDLVDRAWFRDKVTGAVFEMGWQLNGQPTFIRAVDKSNRPAHFSPQQIADMYRGAERMRHSAS